MCRGEVFDVVAVIPGKFGVVTFRVRAEDGRELEIGNGHLLLEQIGSLE